MNPFTAGGIRCPEAYAQGKMLDHSWWSEKMRGRITPSDIDMVVESYGCFLWCEISRDKETISEMSRGQKILLTNLSRLPGVHCVAVLCHELMSGSKQIDTANDIKTATVYFDGGAEVTTLTPDEWRGFACAWTFNPTNAVAKWLRCKVAM
jgi:hypothetical protein